MIESVLQRKNLSLKLKITVKGLISLGIVLLAVVLPQLVHLVAGSEGGVRWLPMYLPVLLGGCLLGQWWGIGAGIASPVISFLITLAFGNPMPASARLPFMAAELAVFGAVSGLFSKKVSENGWMAFTAVLLAQVSGRAAFMLLALVFGGVTPFTPQLIFSQIESGLWGMVLQAVVVPFAVMGLKLILNRKGKEN